VSAPAAEIPSASEIEGLVSQLSWDSVEEECRWFWWVSYRGKAAEELVRIGPPVTTALVKALSDPARAAAAQLILCSIFATESNCEGEIDTSSLPFRYRLGRFMFTSESRFGEPLPAEMLEANRAEWSRILGLRQPAPHSAVQPTPTAAHSP
jgi:hypothetical protein